MPGLAFHSHYWQTQEPPPPVEAGSSSDGGYVPFQAVIVIGSLFGALQALYERWMRRDGESF